jgi:hypothetical protein
MYLLGNCQQGRLKMSHLIFDVVLRINNILSIRSNNECLAEEKKVG